MAGVYYLIFGVLLGTDHGVTNFIAYLCTGVFVFHFTQQVAMAGTRSIADNLNLVRALHFPRASLPLALTLVQLQQLLAAVAVLAAIVLATGERLTWSWLLVVPVVALQTLFNAGLAMILARLAARTTDLKQLMPFVLRTWLYGSGVFYSLDNFIDDAPGPLALLLHWNPMVAFIDLMRYALIGSLPTRGCRGICGCPPWSGRRWSAWAVSCSSGRRRRSTAVSEPTASEPTVIVEGLDVVYQVRGARGGAARPRSPRSAGSRSGAGAAPGREVHAVRNVTFTAYEGQAIGLIGTNGSGKSTLLRTIAGLQPPRQGRVFTRGQPSFLGVNAALMRDLTGERNVVLGCPGDGHEPARPGRNIRRIVDFSGINEKGDFISLPMRTYSSGMAARLRFAIAAAKTHDVLIIDEALTTGDARFQKRSEDRVRELRREAGTVFLVSHANRSIRDTCERAIWLESGEIRLDGPTDEVVDAYEAYTRKR